MTHLDILLELQRSARHRVEGTGPIGRAQIATYTVAMTDEVLELAREIGWKPWKLRAEVNHQRVLEEMADVIAFFGTWLDIVQTVTGASTEEIWSAYLEKAELNRQRFEGHVRGYGVETPALAAGDD
jgi:dimeric dUTPase (all-alpha-NTP-PPase superfamily)